jgi:hypothetical protein
VHLNNFARFDQFEAFAAGQAARPNKNYINARSNGLASASNYFTWCFIAPKGINSNWQHRYNKRRERPKLTRVDVDRDTTLVPAT